MGLSNNKLEKAQERVAELKEFYRHLSTYLFFVCIFIGFNVYTGGYFWAIFPIIGWGIGILCYALKTFRWNPLFSKDWENRKIDEFMKNDNF